MKDTPGRNQHRYSCT